jgi:hypothetical protein
MARLLCVGALAFVLGNVFAASCLKAGAQSEEVTYALHHAAVTYGVSEQCLVNIARRETGGTFWPWVTNQRSGAAGLMQYLRSTWNTLSWRAGYGGASPYDAWAATHVAAWAISHPVESDGGLRHWRTC